MKRVILFIIMMITLSVNINAQSYTRSGNVFISSTGERTKNNKSTATQTKFKTKESDGKEYPIYCSTSGSCYIKKTSKNGKEYKKYLGVEISQEICKELGIKIKIKTKL